MNRFDDEDRNRIEQKKSKHSICLITSETKLKCID